jgi:hypothetical protein
VVADGTVWQTWKEQGETMRTMILVVVMGMVLSLVAPVPGAAQGPPPHAEAQRERERGQQAERGQAQRPQQAQRPPQAQGPPEQRGQGARSAARRGGPPPALETYNRGLAERVVRARAERHGQAPAVEVRREGGHVRLVRADGRELFTMPERTADRLGYWRAVVAPPVGGAAAAAGRGNRYPTVANDPPRNGAPAFCRSGEGHPVWGRDWCLDKGFGLGDGQRAWAVTRPIEDIIFGRPDPRQRRIESDRLGDLLGEIVLGRLAFQSVVLGGTAPLTGLWIGDAEGPRTLRVMSGSVPVAELVDHDRNGRVDTIVFNLGR